MVKLDLQNALSLVNLCFANLIKQKFQEVFNWINNCDGEISSVICRRYPDDSLRCSRKNLGDFLLSFLKRFHY